MLIQNSISISQHPHSYPVTFLCVSVIDPGVDLERLELVFPATNHCVNHLESLCVMCFLHLSLSVCLCLNLCLSLSPSFFLPPFRKHLSSHFKVFFFILLRQYKLETGGAFAASSLQGNQTILGDVMFSK